MRAAPKVLLRAKVLYVGVFDPEGERLHASTATASGTPTESGCTSKSFIHDKEYRFWKDENRELDLLLEGDSTPGKVHLQFVAPAAAPEGSQFATWASSSSPGSPRAVKRLAPKPVARETSARVSDYFALRHFSALQGAVLGARGVHAISSRRTSIFSPTGSRTSSRLLLGQPRPRSRPRADELGPEPAPRSTSVAGIPAPRLFAGVRDTVLPGARAPRVARLIRPAQIKRPASTGCQSDR
jgi:hypothetical protein